MLKHGSDFTSEDFITDRRTSSFGISFTDFRLILETLRLVTFPFIMSERWVGSCELMWSSGLSADFGVWLAERSILSFLDGLGTFLLHFGLPVFEALFFTLEMPWDFALVGLGTLWCLLEPLCGLLVVPLVGRLVLPLVGLLVAPLCGRLVVEPLWGRLEEPLVGREPGTFLRLWVSSSSKLESLLWTKSCSSLGPLCCCLPCDVLVDKLWSWKII